MEAIYTSAPLLLQRELAKRCEKNPKYSLRAFARELGISHAFLSMVLSGKRSLPSKAATKIAENLKLLPGEKKFFLENLDFTKNTPTVHGTIDLDKFFLISNWYHYAILSLLEVKKAKFKAGWIAKRLNISVEDAQDAMDRLVRLGLIKQQGQRWKQTGLPLRFENKISTYATRKYHKQVLTKAIHSLETDPMSTRDFSGNTLAIDPKVLPFAIEKIRKFRRQLAKQLEAMAPSTRVYNLMIQLFPVSTEEPKDE